MSDKKTFAAIDIGSNAIRMVIAEVNETPQGPELVLIKKYRVPIRLGADVFDGGLISGKNLKASARAFTEFQEIAKRYKVKSMRSVATSALREAKNQKAYVELMRRAAGIQIEVIDGSLEADLIFSAVRREVRIEHSRVLLIDVGGGSVELTLSDHGKIDASQSFPFGTVRTLKLLSKRRLGEAQLSLIIGDFIRPLSQFIHKQIQRIDFAVGTGGNLEALGRLKVKLLKRGSRNEMTDAELEKIIQKLWRFSYRERIETLGLKPDRADVILPAAFLVQAILRQASVHRLLVPGVGLKDGLLWDLVKQASAEPAILEVPTAVQNDQSSQAPARQSRTFSNR